MMIADDVASSCCALAHVRRPLNTQTNRLTNYWSQQNIKNTWGSTSAIHLRANCALPSRQMCARNGRSLEIHVQRRRDCSREQSTERRDRPQRPEAKRSAHMASASVAAKLLGVALPAAATVAASSPDSPNRLKQAKVGGCCMVRAAPCQEVAGCCRCSAAHAR